ncbi:LOW QUALITY PROTEIN: conserved hypothetical protein, partial [Streptomyces pristinaespiralis ATCC 25486]
MEGTNPVNKKLAAALSGGAVLVLALSGCGDDSEEKVNAWAKDVCDQAQPQIKKRADAQQAIISTAADGKPADIQAADSKAFADIAAADKALAKAVRDAGVPPVDNGEKLQQDAVKELDATAAAYLDLKKKVDELDPKNQQKFADGLQTVADGLVCSTHGPRGAGEAAVRGAGQGHGEAARLPARRHLEPRGRRVAVVGQGV